jgi:hypothetical protein
MKPRRIDIGAGEATSIQADKAEETPVETQAQERQTA